MSIKLRDHQNGFVSIIVAITFMLILTLITLSFAYLSRRESRQALDRQLSTQAFYAAESGVNDAIKFGITSETSCNNARNINPTSQNDLGNGLQYTCVLVTKSPNTVQFDPITPGTTKVVKLQAAGPISRIRISWQDSAGSTIFASRYDTPFLPQAAYNASYPNSWPNNSPLLRVQAIPFQSGTNRNTLVNNSSTMFLYPGAGSSSGLKGEQIYNLPIANLEQADIVSGLCSSGNQSGALPLYCNVDLSHLGTYYNTSMPIYLQIRSIYRNAKVIIQAFDTDTSTTPVQLLGGQTVIDVTGKANDVLRRVQVRVPDSTSYEVPEFALESADDICKKISVSGSTLIDACEPYNNLN